MRGVTLIEMIVVLLLLGILATGAGLFLINGVQSYMFSSRNSTTTLKVQNALERITLELRDATSITAPTSSAPSNTITYNIVDTNQAGESATQSKTITSTAGMLTITGYNPDIPSSSLGTQPLLDNIQAFTVRVVCDDLDPSKTLPRPDEIKSVNVSLTISGIPTAFTSQVYPRNLLTCTY
jgi:prepilin-type N-terminal cleavage/methylation domain-containing protein